MNHRILIFDLNLGGHYPAYIKHLARYWCNNQIAGILNIVVSPKFLSFHSNVLAAASKCSSGRVNFVAITPQEEQQLRGRVSPISRNLRNFQEWKLLRKYAQSLEASQCLLPFFDNFQLPLAFSRDFSCPLSGIYFRPTFHYTDLPGYVPSLKDQVQHFREKSILFRITHHPKLKTLFCLDPFVTKHIERLRGKTKILELPDPIEAYQFSPSDIAKLRKKLGLDSSRKVLLMFGAIDGRKGIHQLLDAISMLPVELCKKLCLLIVGSINVHSKLMIKTQVDNILSSLPIQIVVLDQYVPDEDIQLYFELSDVILAPYQRQIGMGSTLLRAASARKPVITSNYGLVGEMTRQYRLGAAIDSTVPSEIARAIIQLFSEQGSSQIDVEKMNYLAEQNSVEKFTQTIFDNILAT
jgi:glycosyltransferase involved in cell wall biosynthesis